MSSNSKIRIEFDVSDIKDCEAAVRHIVSAIRHEYGEEFLWKLFSQFFPPKSVLRKSKNVQLMVRYVESGLSMEKCAAMLAEENNSLPRDKRQWGPKGTTSAETMKRQIKRQKDLMARHPDYRRYVELIVAGNKRLNEQFRKIDKLLREGKSHGEIAKLLREGTLHNKKSRDILN
jgi:hypothetical protein